MSKKRLFQILDDMNVSDINNETRQIEVSSNFIETKTAKGGGHLTMGIPEQSVIDIMALKKIPVLILVDQIDYEERQKPNQ